jgi:N-methylhydantoinase B
LSLASGASLAIKGLQIIPAGDRLIVEMPGGGGYGAPHMRDPALVARDVRFGLIEATEAEAAYGVVLSVGGEVDTAETARRRAALAANTPMS